jgi:hypothetical protein
MTFARGARRNAQMEEAPQDFVNVVSSYLPWPERKMICDNSSIFSKAYSDKLFIADTVKWSLSSQTTSLEDLISSLCSSYALVQISDFDGLNNSIIPNPLAESIIQLIQEEIDTFHGSAGLSIDADLSIQIDRLIINMYTIDQKTQISVVSDAENLTKIGTYLCKLRYDNVAIDVHSVKYSLSIWGEIERNKMRILFK